MVGGRGRSPRKKQRGVWGRTAPPPQPVAPSYRSERLRLQGGSPKARRPARAQEPPSRRRRAEPKRPKGAEGRQGGKQNAETHDKGEETARAERKRQRSADPAEGGPQPRRGEERNAKRLKAIHATRAIGSKGRFVPKQRQRRTGARRCSRGGWA